MRTSEREGRDYSHYPLCPPPGPSKEGAIPFSKKLCYTLTVEKNQSKGHTGK